MDSKKAVAIAKDVIKNIHKFKNIATGNYICGKLPSQIVADRDQSLQDCINEVQPVCTVCALGACFMSYARLYNDISVYDMPYSDHDGIDVNLKTLEPKLLEVFDQKQLALIEFAFEKRGVAMIDRNNPSGIYIEAVDRIGGSHDLLQTAIKFGERYDDATERLKAIMKNIIKYGGTFKPKAAFLIAA